jgi:DNA-binding beta-propeller fold protein YncE
LTLLVALLLALTVGSSRLHADTGTCGGVTTTLPFTDVMSSPFFCQIAEAFFSGLTNGTSATTYSPSANVTRDQMAAFITRTQDSALRRGSRRAALDQWATPAALPMTGRITVGTGPQLVKSDGADLWVADSSSGDVKRVRASDGKVLETWTGAVFATGVLVARGRIYIAGGVTVSGPGKLYVIDPSMTAGAVTTLSSTLGNAPEDVTTDGSFIWTANLGGSVSKVDPDSGTTTNISTGFLLPEDILFDGSNLWVTDADNNMLKKLDSSGAILQSVPVGFGPQHAVFDGANIWVPNVNANSITVVRARDGLVLATLTGNGLNEPLQAAFDGQRILITNFGGNSVSLWKAADLTPIGTFATGPGTVPHGACSDGVNFWITLQNTNQLARF